MLTGRQVAAIYDRGRMKAGNDINLTNQIDGSTEELESRQKSSTFALLNWQDNAGFSGLNVENRQVTPLHGGGKTCRNGQLYISVFIRSAFRWMRAVARYGADVKPPLA